MAANTTIYGVQITLDREYTENTAIGLYTVSSLSYLRWSEATLAGVAEGAGKWATGILLKDGIGDIDASSDLSRGGNVAEYSGLTISVANAEALMQSLKDLQINLTGFSVTVTEFVGTIADSDATSRTVQFTGVVEDIKWGDTTLTIALKNSAYKRETNLSSTNADGVTTPVCFGKLTPPLTKIVDGVSVASTDINNLAKFVRTVDTYDDDTYNDTFFTGATNSIKIFPIESLTPIATRYVIKVSTTPIVFYPLDPPIDTYVIVVSGTGEGQIREVAYIGNYGFTDIIFGVKDVFLTELSETNDDTRSWIQFVKIGRNYNGDSWPCKDFLKSVDGTATETPELFSYADDKFNRIADFGFTIKDTNNNALDIDGSQYSDNIDNVDSFIELPITSLSLEDSADLVQWNCNGIDFAAYGFASIYTAQYPLKLVDGLYKPTSAGNVPNGNLVLTNTSLVDDDHSYDKVSTTYAEFSPTISQVATSTLRLIYLKVLKFNLPVLPTGIEIDSIHLGIKFNSQSDLSWKPTSLGSPVFAIFRRFAYNKTTDMIIDDKNLNTAEKTVAGVTVDDIMDQYYTDTVATNNLNFYRKGVVAGAEYSSLTGYTLFQITDKVNEYNTMVEGGLFFNRVYEGSIFPDPSSFTDTLKLYEVCIIIKLASSDIKKEIYSPLSGRNYGGTGADTWGTRKTAAALMENPKDIIEHCDRLKNWSEIAGHTVKDWGHKYSSDALIKTSGEGSFDSTNLNYLTDQKVAMEITDAAKQTTTAIVKKLADTFGLCSYIDSSGNECIETLELTNPTGSANTITLTDQIGAIGDIQEPRIENIFCEPIVNYLYNQGSGKYDRTLKVTNIDATAWAAAYTPGFTLADGEIVWNSCKVLYNQFRQIETCPSEFSDQCCIADYATAVYYIKRKIAWMGKMRLPTIAVAYSKGKDYNIYKHLMVQFPMHTNNVSVECIIEKITKSKNTNTVKIDCVILGDVEDAWYDTSDSTNVKQDTPTLTDPAVIDQ